MLWLLIAKDSHILDLSRRQPAPDLLRAYGRRATCLDLRVATARAIAQGRSSRPPSRLPKDARTEMLNIAAGALQGRSWGVWRAHSRMLFAPTALTMAASSPRVDWLTFNTHVHRQSKVHLNMDVRPQRWPHLQGTGLFTCSDYSCHAAYFRRKNIKKKNPKKQTVVGQLCSRAISPQETLQTVPRGSLAYIIDSFLRSVSFLFFLSLKKEALQTLESHFVIFALSDVTLTTGFFARFCRIYSRASAVENDSRLHYTTPA